MIAGSTGYVGGAARRGAAAPRGEEVRALARDTVEGEQRSADSGAELGEADVSSPRPWRQRSTASASPTTSSIRWAAGATATSRSATAKRRRNFGRRRERGRRRADRLHRRARRRRLGAPAQPPRDAPRCSRARASRSPTCAPPPWSAPAASRSAPSIYLVKRLPVMITPRWTATRTQPIAIADVSPTWPRSRRRGRARAARSRSAAPTSRPTAG